jgi:hypothetical protein
LPRPAVTALKRFVQGSFPVRIDAASHVALFAYDNGTFIVQSYRDAETEVTISIAGANRRLQREGGDVAATTTQPSLQGEVPATAFSVRIPAHSYQLFTYR